MTTSLFTDLPTNLPDELLTMLLNAANTRIERIVSQGHASPDGFWYDQDELEWVIVLQGAARLRFDDNVLEMKPGDFVNIPAHKKHRVEWTTPDGEYIAGITVHNDGSKGQVWDFACQSIGPSHIAFMIEFVH